MKTTCPGWDSTPAQRMASRHCGSVSAFLHWTSTLREQHCKHTAVNITTVLSQMSSKKSYLVNQINKKNKKHKSTEEETDQYIINYRSDKPIAYRGRSLQLNHGEQSHDLQDTPYPANINHIRASKAANIC